MWRGHLATLEDTFCVAAVLIVLFWDLVGADRCINHLVELGAPTLKKVYPVCNAEFEKVWPRPESARVH